MFEPKRVDLSLFGSAEEEISMHMTRRIVQTSDKINLIQIEVLGFRLRYSLFCAMFFLGF